MSSTTPLLYKDETYAIRGAIYDVFREMGNGFEENIYQECLEMAFKERGIPFDAQKELTLYFMGRPLKHHYKPDFFCYGKIIVEIKACAALANAHRVQVLNYLRLTKTRLGLLVNFGALGKEAEVERLVL